MNNPIEEAKKILGIQVQQDEYIRVILAQHLNIKYHQELANEGKENAGYLAYATYAIEVGVKLANLILAVKKPETHRSFRALSDLTFELSSNEFWNRNSQVLMPLVMVIMSSHRDTVALQMEKLESGEYGMYDKLITGGAVVPLEIFSVLLYLVGGAELMVTSSLPLKIDLANILLK